MVSSKSNALVEVIVVLGVSGSGKSTLAEALAQHYGYVYLDADDFHSDEARARMARGEPLTDAMRIPWIDALCKELRERAQAGESCVLAFSGLKRTHRNLLRQVEIPKTFLFLSGDKAVIHERMARRTDHFMPPTLLDSQFAALEIPTGEPDVKTVDIAGTLPEMIQIAVDLLNTNPLRKAAVQVGAP
jgi:gluconokinase